MTWIADLAPCTYFDGGPPTSSLIAVGWLGAGREFPRGPLAAQDQTALTSALARAWSPHQYLGSHECELCEGEPATGGGDLFVPALEAGAVYATPTMIGHYVEAHSYAPPAPFLAALRACPPLRSLPYLRAMAGHRPHDLGWCVGILDALPLDEAPPPDLAPLLVAAAREHLTDAVANETRMRRRPDRPRPDWAAELAPRVGRAARTLAIARSREGLPQLEQARAVFTDEPHASTIAAAIEDITRA